MVNLAQHLQPLPERLERTIIERFQDFSRMSSSGVVSGLKPSLRGNSTGSLTVDYSGGDCYVAGTKHTVASGSVTVTASTTTYVWVDDAGAVQSGTAWPGTDHTKLFGIVSDSSIATHLLMDEETYRRSLLGFDQDRSAIVLPPAGNPGSTVSLYSHTIHNQWSSGRRGFGHHFTVKRPMLLQSVDIYFNSVSADVVTTMRGGVWSLDTEDWIPGAYYDRDLSGGLNYNGGWLTFPFSPYLLMPGEYVFGCGVIVRGSSWQWDLFNCYTYDTGDFGYLPDNGAEYCAPSMYQTSVDSHGHPGAYLWDDVAGKFRKDTSVDGQSSSQMQWRIRGRDASIGYVNIKDTLAAEPSRFLGSANTRARDITSGDYSEADPNTQPAQFSISLDDGANFTDVVNGQELTTVYGGTDFVGLCVPYNDNALELELNAAGFFYET